MISESCHCKFQAGMHAFIQILTRLVCSNRFLEDVTSSVFIMCVLQDYVFSLAIAVIYGQV